MKGKALNNLACLEWRALAQSEETSPEALRIFELFLRSIEALEGLEADEARLEAFRSTFGRRLFSLPDGFLKNQNTPKVLLNLQAFMTERLGVHSRDSMPLLELALKVREVPPVITGQILTRIAAQLSAAGSHLKAEGLLRSAADLLKGSGYPEVEGLFIFGEALKRVDIRVSEGEEKIQASKELAGTLQPWAPLQARFFIDRPRMAAELAVQPPAKEAQQDQPI